MKKPELWIKLKRIDGNVVHVRVKQSEGYEQGFTHKYKKDKRWEVCNELHGYKREWENGKLCIGQREGNVTAVALWGNPDPEAPGENYACLLRTHQFSEGHKTLVGGVQIPWMWLIIGLAVVVLAVVGFQYIKSMQNNPVNPEQPPATEQTITEEQIYGN